MKDIKKLNSALNDIDERLIEEAAQGGRARSVPGWVKYGAVIAGGAAGIHAYTNGRDFTPSGESRAMRTNQVHFDGDESTIGKQDESEQNKKSESEMYERDANAEEQAKPQTGDSASYLFDSEKQPETSANNTLFDGNGTAAAIWQNARNVTAP